MKRTILILILSTISSAVYCADTTSSKRKTGNFVNPGISIGVGSGRTNLAMPSLNLKIWRFNLKGLFYERDLVVNNALQLEAELFQLFPKHPSVSTFVVVSRSYSERLSKHNKPDPVESRFIRTMSLGINQYWHDRRSKATVKLGLSDYNILTGERTSGRRPFKHVYGELSYNHYLFKFRDYKDHDVIKKFFVRRWTRTKKDIHYPVLSKWLNPYLSIGIGHDRAIIAPAIGIRSGPFNLKGSVLPSYGGSTYSSNINWDALNIKTGRIFSQHLGIGFVRLISESYGDLYGAGSTSTATGGTLNFNMYRNNGRHGFEFKLGYANHLIETDHVDYWTDPDNFVNWKTSRNEQLFIGGFSINFYLFRTE